MSNIIDVIGYKEVDECILNVRGQDVILDRDVAILYGVPTREINRAVKNNPNKFPIGYVIALEDEEKSELVENFHRFNSLKHSTVLPSAFTEKGLYMLATILKSPRAAETTIAIVETFAKIRELSKAISILPDVQDDSQRKSLSQRSSEILLDILDNNILDISGDEISIELNLAIAKVKRVIKRERRK